jgi:glycosyltransferase involved in cell wall biosynthesis
LKVLIIHPSLSILAGGEFLCLNVIKAVQEAGFEAILASDNVDPKKVEETYGMSDVFDGLEWIRLPQFRQLFPKLRAFQTIPYGRMVKRFLLDRVAGENVGLVFSTQSSIFDIPGTRSYHFCYGSYKDLFVYPFAFYRENYRPYSFVVKKLVRAVVGAPPSPTWILALSSQVLDNLKQNHYDNASAIYPPTQLMFTPAAIKKKRIVQASRFTPGKRLEWFCEVAKRLPEYDFALVCRDEPNLRKLTPGYAEKILASMPQNIEYVASAIRQTPGYFEESKVHLYTGLEPSIALVLVEAIGAGCIPIAPYGTGTGEVIETLGIGYRYNTISEAVNCVRAAIESKVDPLEISKRAQLYSPEKFRSKIKEIVSRTALQFASRGKLSLARPASR